MPVMKALSNPRISATAFSLALLLASLWWGAFTTMTMLHDDAKFVAALSATLDKPAVRAQISRWLGAALDNASPVTGAELSKNPAFSQLQQTITAEQNLAPMAAALTGVALQARNDAVTQLDQKQTPKQSVRLQLAPLFDAAEIKVDKKTAKALGLRLDRTALSTELLTGPQLDRLQLRYTLTALLSRWAGWVALALLVLSVATSAKPLRLLAIASGAVTLVALFAPYALARLATWLASNGLGQLLAPVVKTVEQGVRGYSWPVAIVGTVLVFGFAIGHRALSSRRR
jgi:hypothetical protein